MQVLQNAPRMADFRMASSRVGAEGGTALAEGLAAGQHPCCTTLQKAFLLLTFCLTHVLQLVAPEMGPVVIARWATRWHEGLPTSVVHCPASHSKEAEQAASSAGDKLERLDLSDNPMTEEVAPALAEALRQQSALLQVNLNDTSLQDEGISAIAEVLIHHLSH